MSLRTNGRLLVLPLVPATAAAFARVGRDVAVKIRLRNLNWAESFRMKGLLLLCELSGITSALLEELGAAPFPSLVASEIEPACLLQVHNINQVFPELMQKAKAIVKA